MDALLSRARRLVFALAAVIAASTMVLADDLAGQARALLGQGLRPDAAALRLMERGADPEDAAATLFQAAPDLHAMRAVAFAVVRAGIEKDRASAVPLAAGVAGLVQPAPVPVAAAVAVALPGEASNTAAVLAEAAPQAAPLIAAAIAKLAPDIAPEVAAAVARGAPSQALFTASAARQAAPGRHEDIIAAVARATGIKADDLRTPDTVVELVGGNAVREALEVLADLPIPPVR